MEGKNKDTFTCSYEFSYLAGARRILLGLRLRPFPASRRFSQHFRGGVPHNLSSGPGVPP